MWFPWRNWVVAAVLLSCAHGPAGPAFAQINGGTFNATGLDVVPRLFHAGSTLQHRQVMVTGGMGLILIPPSLFSRDDIGFYDPEPGTFSTAYERLDGGGVTFPRLTIPRSSHTQTTLGDGRVLITGGHSGAAGADPGFPTAVVELFDPQTGAVMAGPDMASTRAMHTATLLTDGRVVVAGGGSTWQIFSPPQNTWSENHALVRSRMAHAAVLLPNFAGTYEDDRVLLIGGAGSGPTTMELLDPGEGTASLLQSSLDIGVDDLAALRLPDGRVFIVGGQNLVTGDTVSNTYLLNAAADTIAPAPSVPGRAGGIADHQMARFTHYVAIFGGEQQIGGVDTILDYAAIFDSRTETWLDHGTMVFKHDDFVTAPLPDCSLLLVGGGVPFLGLEVPSATSEVFALTIAGQCPLGDFDDDGDVDLEDYASLLGCLTGPGSGPVRFECMRGDFDSDDDTDLADFGAFQAAFTGD